MENDIVSLFLSRKKQNISKYAQIFINYNLSNKVSLNKIIGKIVEIYIDNYYFEKNDDFSILADYFEVGKNKESLMKDILLSSLLFYKNSGLEAQIDDNLKTIVILSNSIYLAINYDNYTNEFLNTYLDIDIRINSFFDEYSKKLKLTDEYLDNLKNDLLDETKKNVNSEKKFWKYLVDSNYVLTYKNSKKYKNYFLVDYYYDIKLLNRYDKSEVERISQTKGIYDDIISIYIEKLSVTVLKDLLCKNKDDRYFINIYTDYFNKNKNLINLNRIIYNDSVKKRIVFCFDIDDIKKNINVIKDLYDKGYVLALNRTTSSTLATTSFDMFKYVFVDSKSLEKYNSPSLDNVSFISIDEEYNNIDLEYILKENR